MPQSEPDDDKLCPRCLEILSQKAREGLLTIVFEDPVDQVVFDGIRRGMTQSKIALLLAARGVCITQQAVSYRLQALRRKYPSLIPTLMFWES